MAAMTSNDAATPISSLLEELDQAIAESVDHRGLAANLGGMDAESSSSSFAPNSGEYACGQERASTVWLNRADVQAALHVKLVGKARATGS